LRQQVALMTTMQVPNLFISHKGLLQSTHFSVYRVRYFIYELNLIVILV